MPPSKTYRPELAVYFVWHPDFAAGRDFAAFASTNSPATRTNRWRGGSVFRSIYGRPRRRPRCRRRCRSVRLNTPSSCCSSTAR